MTSCGKSADELFQEGRAFLDNEAYGDAIEVLQSASKKNPGHAGIHNALGVAFLRVDSTASAIASFNRAIDIDSTDYKAYFNRGNAKRGLELDQGALEDFGKAIEIYPELTSAYVNRGAIYAKYQDFDNALFDFESALRLDDQNPMIYLYKGRIELRISNKPNALDDAIFDLKKAISLKNDLGEAWYWLGLVEITKENQTEGCQNLQTAAENGFEQASNAFAQNCLQ